jgi:hypothetical protein
MRHLTGVLARMRCRLQQLRIAHRACDQLKCGDPSAIPCLKRRATNRALEIAYFSTGGHGFNTAINRAALAGSLMRFPQPHHALNGRGLLALHCGSGRGGGVGRDRPAATSVPKQHSRQPEMKRPQPNGRRGRQPQGFLSVGLGGWSESLESTLFDEAGFSGIAIFPASLSRCVALVQTRHLSDHLSQATRGLRLDDFPGEKFGQRIAPVNNADGAQSLLIGGRQAADLFRSHRHILQQAINGIGLSEHDLQFIKGNVSVVVVPETELSCSMVPPICLAREAISFSPDPCSLG